MEDKVPRGLRSLPRNQKPSSSSSNDLTLAHLQTEATAMERWWTQPRWKHTTRIYSGEFDFFGG
jgi:hypothetical protein